MHSRVGLVTKYLSDEWFSLIREASVYAYSVGLDAYIYDEDMWPSGYAGGEVVRRRPDLRHCVLACVSNERLDPEDEIAGEISDGRKIVVRKSQKSYKRFNDSSYIDTLNPEAVGLFLETTHELYNKKVGDLFGREIKGIFTDEPCYNCSLYGVPNVVYSPILRGKIKREYGFDILDKAALLFENEGDYKEVRRKYYAAAGEQFRASYFEQYSRWCQSHGLIFTGHVGNEDSMRGQIAAQGSAMACYKYFDYPGVDKLQRGLWQFATIKQLDSAAAIFGKTVKLCECFGGIGQESGIAKRKRITDWLVTLGINLINPHLTPYSLRGERKRDYPPAIGWQQPCWGEEGAFSAYTRRICEAFSESEEVGERVLVVEPLFSVAARYTPIGNGVEVDSIDRQFAELVGRLVKSGVPFDVCDEVVLSEYSKEENGKFVLGSKTFNTIILQNCERLPEKVVDVFNKCGVNRLIDGFLKCNCGGERLDIDDFCKKYGSERKIEVEYLGDGSSSDGFGCGVLFTERKIGDGVTAFICNTENRAAKFSVRTNSPYSVIDLTDGVCFRGEKPQGVLSPYGSVTLFFGESRENKDYVSVGSRFYSSDGCGFEDMNCVKEGGFSVRFGTNMLPIKKSISKPTTLT